jgi:hypothetical protein
MLGGEVVARKQARRDERSAKPRRIARERMRGCVACLGLFLRRGGAVGSGSPHDRKRTLEERGVLGPEMEPFASPDSV